jgi:hypothetical protein
MRLSERCLARSQVAAVRSERQERQRVVVAVQALLLTGPRLQVRLVALAEPSAAALVAQAWLV